MLKMSHFEKEIMNMKKQLRLIPFILILSLLIVALPLVVFAADAGVEANILEGKTFVAADRATATHSGAYNGSPVNYDYTKLTDNDMHLHTGRFSTKSSDSTQVFDGIVDLKGGYVLNELQIYDFNPTATATPFMGTGLEIQVYSEGEWTTVISCASNDEIIPYRKSTNYLSFDLSGVKAEKIRIYIPSRLGTNSISIYEIKCSGVIDSIADVFEGKTFVEGDLATPFFVGTHSGVSVNYDYTKLTDNNTHYQTGRFSTKAADEKQVFDGIIDLGGGYFLNELKINDFNSTATTAPFMGTALEIQVYSLGKWTTVISCSSNDEIVAHRLDSVYLSFDLGGVRAEKVRIYIPARLGTNSISINEIECSATVDHKVYNYFTNLLLGKTFVPTESAAKEVHVDPTYDYGYTVVTDDSYAPKGGRFSTISASKTQHVDATVNLDGVYELDELRIYDFGAQAEPNASNPGYLGPNLTIDAYVDGVWKTVLYCTREEYGAHRVTPSEAWGAQYLSFDLDGVTAEMLRIYIPSNIEGNSISFYEITCSGNKIADHVSHSGGNAVKENEIFPTCSSLGSYDSVVYCTVCGTEMSRTTVPVDKISHSYKSVVTAPNCENGGYTTYTCTVCEDSYVSDKTSALGHNYKSVVTAPNCENGGYTTYTCTVCEDSYVADEREALGHTEQIIPGCDATCTSAGLSDGILCTACHKIITKQTVIAPNGHSYGAEITAPDCNNGGYTTFTCSVCSNSYVTNRVSPLGHTYSAAVTAPDCEKGGYTDYTCTACGYSYVGAETAPLGHTAGKAVKENEIAPDCTNEGSYEYATYCTVCGVELSREVFTIDARSHLASPAVIENCVLADCTNVGRYDNAVYCLLCGTELGRDTVVVDAFGHIAGSAVEENRLAPKCDTDGKYDLVVYCLSCKDELSRDTVVIDAIGHDWKEATTEAPKTCKICGETEGEKLPELTPDPDNGTDLAPEKDHGECEASSTIEKILNLIVNFFRSLIGLPEKCVCGDELT